MLSIFVALLISFALGSSNRGEWGTCKFYLTPLTCRGKPLSSPVNSKLECLWTDDGRGCYAGALEDVNAYCQQFESTEQCSYHVGHCEFKNEKCAAKSPIDKAKEAAKRAIPMVRFDDTNSRCFALPLSTCQGAKDGNNRVCAWNSSAKQCQPLRNIKCSIWNNEQLCRNAYGSDSACKWDNESCTESDREDVETFAICSYQLSLDDCTQHSHCIWFEDYCEGMNSVDGKPHKDLDNTRPTKEPLRKTKEHIPTKVTSIRPIIKSTVITKLPMPIVTKTPIKITTATAAVTKLSTAAHTTPIPLTTADESTIRTTATFDPFITIETTFSFIELCSSLTDQRQCLSTGCDWNLTQKRCSSGGDLYLQKAHPRAHTLQKIDHSALIGIDGEQKPAINIFWIILAGTLSGFLFALCVYSCLGRRYRRKKQLMCYDISSHPHPEIYEDLMSNVHEPVKMDDLPENEESIPNPSNSNNLAYV